MKNKAQFELVPNMFIIIVGVMGVFILIVLLLANIGTSANIVKSNIYKLNAIDATYIVEKCLKNKGDIIEEKFLDENNNKNLCELCGICETVVYGSVEDIETQKKWKFDYSMLKKTGRFFKHVWEKVQFWKKTKHTTNSIIIDLKTENGEIHIGRLYVTS